MAHTGPSGARGISAFAVSADTEGIGYGHPEAKLSWLCQPSFAVTFDRVRVPAEWLLGSEDEGFATP
jgi:alkylation response protein AidB-like acyl-CoA dehydrogenase